MPIDCVSILEVAKELAAFDSEAHQRSAISRAYYASLHCVDRALPRAYTVPDHVKNSAGSHEAVIQALTQWGKSITPGRQSARYAAMKMPKLKAARKDADYHLTETISSGAASKAIEMADDIFQLMAKVSDDMNRANG